MTQRRMRSIYVGLVVSALVALFAVQRAYAVIIVDPVPVEFGPLSLASGEVFRFYVSNPASDGACEASVMVYDKTGRIVAQAQPSALPGRI